MKFCNLLKCKFKTFNSPEKYFYINSKTCSRYPNVLNLENNTKFLPCAVGMRVLNNKHNKIP